MATIKDIAREAGVSHGTVSNVLNKTGKVSIEKIRLVEAAIKRLGYVPNTQAQLLRQGAPTTVAIILPSLHEETYLDLYTAVSSSIRACDYDTVVHTTDDLSSKECQALEKLRVSNVAAIVTVSCLSLECSKHYSIMPCPIVYVDRKPEALRHTDSFFSFDFSEVGSQLASYILEKGWKKVAFFGSSNAFHQASTIRKAIERDTQERGVALDCYASDINLSLNKAFDIIQSGEIYDAIITPSSIRAESISTAIQFSGNAYRPEVIALGASRVFHGAKISTYELNYGQMGAKLAELLMAHLQQKQPMPRQTILKGTGFPYRFPNVKRMNGQSITMLTLENPSTAALRKLLPMFEAASGISVKLVCAPYEDLPAQIAMLSPGFHYDLVRMDVARLDGLGEQTYIPLKEVGLDKKNLPQKLIYSAYDNYSQLNGVMYALPFDPSVLLFLYRSDLFEDAKIQRAYYERWHEQLEVPATMEQYLRVAEFFTQSQNPESPTKYGATCTNGTAAYAASDFLPYYLEKVECIPDELDRIRINSPEMVKAMAQYHQMERYASHQPWWSDSIRRFADGEVATAVVYSNYASSIINSKHSTVAGRVGAAVVPGGKPLLGGGVIGISRYSEKLDACRQFFNWYYSPEVASLVVRLGGTSPLVDVYNDFQNFRVFPWLSASKESFALGTRGLGNLDVPGFSIQKYEFALGTAVKNLSSGILTPEEAAAMAQSIYDQK